MTPVKVSVWELKTRVERKAFAYGVPADVSTLLGEYVVELIREIARKQESIHA
jgi:hypothetical protein